MLDAKLNVTEVVLRQFSGAAASFFGNARVPASIIVGSSLGALFVFGSADTKKRTPTERFVTRIYQLFSWFAFVLSLNTVITCTVGTTSAMYAGFDPMAETGYSLLKREFEYVFVSTRWSLCILLLLFVIIVTLQLLLSFDLLKDPSRRNTARFVLLSASALTAQILLLMSIVNCIATETWAK